MDQAAPQNDQVLSLGAFLKKHHLRLKKGLGQNFLLDRRAAEKIVAAADLQPGQVVVEVGPGLGALTIPLAQAGVRVVAVELDQSLLGPLRDRLGKKYRDQVEIVHADALAFDFTTLGPGLVVLGNLPYHIAAPLIFKLLALGPVVDRAVLTLQKELADRLLSPPGPKTYGQLTVQVRLHAKVEPILTLPPGAFLPQPKVASRTIRLIFNQPAPLPLVDEAFFVRLVQAAFGQRRKTLRQALLVTPLGLDQARLEKALELSGLAPTLRAERLSVTDFIVLSNNLCSLPHAR